jgi:hypothetical protein
MYFPRIFKKASFWLAAASAFAILRPEAALAASAIASDTTGAIIRGGLFALGFVTITFIFYKPVYGLLVRYYHPSFCRQVVLSMILLYLLGWMSLGAFVIFDFGFWYFWIKWVFVFLGSLWLIAFAVIMLRGGTA